MFAKPDVANTIQSPKTIFNEYIYTYVLHSLYYSYLSVIFLYKSQTRGVKLILKTT